ncbi:substrate-binding domain-containing protein [Desulfovibrio ferrophilus]|nr:substrate-binding domain-containing protein [Desulfovibrio ferrophilus]
MLVATTVALSLIMMLATVGMAKDVLMMATTTSTDNTGLLDELAPMFTEDTGIDLRWTAIGTGKALAMGRNCDVDVLLVHAPGAEKKEVDAGNAIDRTQLMYNDFVIIGPASDPAGVKGMGVVEAMKTFAVKHGVFCSRGDNSGTNKKELSLWKAAGMAVPEKQDWYVQTGQGMIATIRVAAEKGGYTMTDRGTYIKYEANEKGNPALKVLVEGDKTLFNQYSAMAVNPAKCPKVQYELAGKFIDWMASAKAQKAIADFRLMGKQLFTPNAGM